MKLIFDIALTHVRARARQTVIAVFGVATGVGFAIMIAAMLEGSEDDFIRTLVDTIPHVAISDERDRPTRQPAQLIYDAAEIHGLTPQVRRRGIKNPLATIAALQSWVPGTLTPSVRSNGLLRYAARDVTVSIIGIDPQTEVRVSKLAEQMRAGTVKSLYTANNALILGSRLADKVGAKVGANVTVVAPSGVRIGSTVVGLFRSGSRQVDETTAYTLVKTAQILENQIGLVNEIRVRLADPLHSRPIATRIAAETGYKAVSWEEANEDLMSTLRIRNIMMFTIVGAILLVASFGTYNIISTITHEKTRDIAIMKSFGFTGQTIRRIFVIEALIMGALGALVGFAIGYLLCRWLGSIEFKNPFVDYDRLPLAYSWRHYFQAGLAALISSFVAGYFPARRAANVHPVEIIRGAA
jgi:lipoprotein-releasing system permease protein